jgi:hypothetical protein
MSVTEIIKHDGHPVPHFWNREIKSFPGLVCPKAALFYFPKMHCLGKIRWEVRTDFFHLCTLV